MKNISDYIKIPLQGRDLTFEQAGELLDIIFAGEVSEVQIAALLTALQAKGIKAPELAGFANSLREHALSVETDIEMLVDTCGTGGGRVKTLNISTTAAIVAAGAGVNIAKHGNRGITSGCGSADVLEALGVNINGDARTVKNCIEQTGIGFMFAPNYHPAMKYVQPVRKSLGFRTVFNILGPLANPAKANCQVLGVADPELMELVAEALTLMNSKYALVVHADGLDEISTATPTKVIELKDGNLKEYRIDPARFGFEPTDLSKLKAANAAASAEQVKKIITGQDKGPARDIIVLNAAAAIIAGQLTEDFENAIPMAAESIDNGKAQTTLEKLIKVSNS